MASPRIDTASALLVADVAPSKGELVGRFGPLWAITLPLVVWLVVRGFAKRAAPGSSSPVRNTARILAGLAGAAFGLAFAGLLGWSFTMTPAANGAFDLRLEIVRYGSLVAGVVFLVFVLAAAMPFGLDLLERSGFVPMVGARHVRATKSGFLTVISVLSILGVCVSSCALCSVRSIMGGFGHDLKQKILGNNAHIVVDTKATGGFREWDEALSGIRMALGPKGAATPVVGGDAMSSSTLNTAGVLLRGVDPESIGNVIDLRKNIELGRFEYLTDTDTLANLPVGEPICRLADGTLRRKTPDIVFSLEPDVDPAVREAIKPRKPARPGVILGRELAKSLHVCVGDEITLLSPTGELGPMGVMPRTRKFRVAGIFYSGMYEYDASHAYITLPEAQAFFDIDDRITQIDVRVDDPEGVERVTPEVRAAVERAYEPSRRPDIAPPPPELRLRDWKEMNKNLFSALKLESLATFMILSIAIAVASFCIVCTLLLMVTEKSRQIAILKALGASDGEIMRIFMVEGVAIGAIGTVFGVGIALASSTGLKWFGARLPPEVYYIDRLPVNVDLADYALVALASLAICTLSTLYPAYAASRVAPVDGLRHE
jgi:lipoprotein-releasing system permease protein